MATIYDFKALASNGKEIDFADFRGKVLNVFATSGGSTVDGSYNDLKKAYPQYTWGEKRLMN